MLRRPSVVRCRPLSSVVVRPPFSKIFFSKTAGPVKAKFHSEPSWVGGTKVVCSGHLGQNFQKSSSPEPKGQLSWALVCMIGALGPSKFVQMMTLVELDLFYGNIKVGPLCFYMGKTVRKSFNEKNLQ